MGKLRATLAVFAYAGVTPETLECIAREAREWPSLMLIFTSNDALIDRARSRVATEFLDAPRKDAGDVLLMVDHDVTWARGDVRRLVESCLKTRGVVGGIYSKRTFGGGVAAQITQPGQWAYGSDTLVTCRTVSTGFFAIHRGVLEKLADGQRRTLGDFYPFFIPLLVEHPLGALEEASEDWAFCFRAEQAGFAIHADLKPQLVHIGTYGYRVLDGLSAATPNRPLTFTVAPGPRSRALRDLIRDVHEYTGIPPDQVDRAVTDGRRNLATLWYTYGGFEREEEFYLRDDVGRCYLLDLAGWHMNIGSNVLEPGLEGTTGKRALDFGAGIGTAALVLAEQGNDVSVIEPNKRMVEFLRGRAKRLELPVKVVEAPQGHYDIIICWHVLEHVKRPLDYARMLVAHLAPGGRVFTDSDFQVDEVHPMHHEDGHRTDGSDIWEAAGLERDTGYWWVRAAEDAVANPTADS